MMAIYRAARWLFVHHVPLLPWILRGVNRIVFGVVLPPGAQLGKDVLLSYRGLGTVIHHRAVIGNRVVIGTGVTIGGRSGHDRVPVLGDDVFVGTGAKILGPVTIGEGCQIGANAVVLQDLPPHSVAVGVPARVVRVLGEHDLRPDYRKGGR